MESHIGKNMNLAFQVKYKSLKAHLYRDTNRDTFACLCTRGITVYQKLKNEMLFPKSIYGEQKSPEAKS